MLILKCDVCGLLAQEAEGDGVPRPLGWFRVSLLRAHDHHFTDPAIETHRAHLCSPQCLMRWASQEKRASVVRDTMPMAGYEREYAP